ncbi:MAG: DUF4843 domain-containing protein, partial [Duncaniella sp.]|nr:DUF4843 domain-containing protein [Duncaniella sp.]
MKIPHNIMTLGVAAALFASCSENDYKVYDTTQKDSVFFSYVNNQNVSDSVFNFAFNFDINNSYTLTIPVSVMGSIKSYDRPVKIDIVADSSTMIQGTHYEIVEAGIPAGATEGAVKIKLLRDRDPRLLTESVKGRFVIGENDELRTVKGSVFKITFSDIRPESKPEWWLTYGPFPKYSYENAQLFFQYFYLLKDNEETKDIFDEIIRNYDDYFVNGPAVRGPWTMYELFLRKYVCIPLHEKHPEVEFMSDP